MKGIYGIFAVEGKTAVVTGASKGIGSGIAECFAKVAVNLVLVNRNPQEGADAKKKLNKYGTKVLSIPADVSQKDRIEDVVSKTVDEFGRIDILINNAAVINRGPLLELEETEWDHGIDINLKGCFLCGQTVAKQMVL